MISKLSLITVLVAVGVGVAACGGSSSSSPSSSSASSSAAGTQSSSTAAPAGGGKSALAIAADPSGQLKFTKKTLSAKAGKVTVDFTNASPTDHNFTVQTGTSGATVGATPTFQGGSKTVTVDLKPGTYTFFCSVPGHRQAGMVGTLKVS